MRFRRRSSGKKGHGALWSIIYIDLMTQIMAFFVILWSVEHGSKLTATPSLGTGVGMGDQTARMVDLPGDVLFASGQTAMAPDGKAILDKLFGDADSGVLSFDQGGLAQRKLVIHGHTDDVGIKDSNFQLGYQRAYAVYQEIRRHSKEVPDHIVLCTHADNTPARPVPQGADRTVANEARSKNRRITIEDLVVATKPGEATSAASKPGETRPGAKPDETKPGETKPGETKPGETKPGETRSGALQSDPIKPGDTRSSALQPDPIKPGDASPRAGNAGGVTIADTRRAKAAPGETRP